MKGRVEVSAGQATAFCACGALAVKVPAPWDPFGRVSDEQVERALSMIAADTSERCRTGVDRAPACEERARAKRHLQLVG